MALPLEQDCIFSQLDIRCRRTECTVCDRQHLCDQSWCSYDILCTVESNCVNNKLYSIYQTVGSVVHNKGLSRHESVIINRLRIGHTRLTHSYLLSGDDQPTCSTCGHPLTVRHILLNCVDLQDVCRRHFSVTCLRDLFQTVDSLIIIDFIKDIHFYSLL